jgi:hypothetical protein
MKTPFKMTPGRGNMPKTGRGVAPTLMSKSPMYQELTAQGLKSQKKVKANIANEAKKQVTSTPTLPGSGVKVNSATGEATAKAYEKKYVEGGEGQAARIIGGDGKVVSSSTGSTPNAKEKLKAEFNKLKTSTESSRKENASKIEVFGGAKRKLTAAEEKMQANLTNTKSPAKQMVKPASKKVPMKQMSKLKKKSC